MRFGPVAKGILWLAACGASAAVLAPGLSGQDRARARARVVDSLVRMSYRDLYPERSCAGMYFSRSKCRVLHYPPTVQDLEAGSGVIRVSLLPDAFGPVLRTDQGCVVVGHNVEILGDPAEVDFVMGQLTRERYNWTAVWSSLTVLCAAASILRHRPKQAGGRGEPSTALLPEDRTSLASPART